MIEMSLCGAVAGGRADGRARGRVDGCGRPERYLVLLYLRSTEHVNFRAQQ